MSKCTMKCVCTCVCGSVVYADVALTIQTHRYEHTRMKQGLLYFKAMMAP